MDLRATTYTPSFIYWSQMEQQQQQKLTTSISNVSEEDHAGGLGDINFNENHAMYIIFILISCLGIVGNGLVFGTLIKRRLSGDVAEVLLCNQSLIDLLTATCLLLATVAPVRKSFADSSLKSEVMCRVLHTQLLLMTFFLLSIYNLMTIAVEQYVQIAYPIFHHAYIKGIRARYFVAISWFTGSTISICTTVPTSGLNENNECVEFGIFANYFLRQFTGVLRAFLSYILPLFVILYSLLGALVCLQQKKRKIGPLAQQSIYQVAKSGTLKTVALFSGVFVACWSLNSFIFLLSFFIEYEETFYSSTTYQASVLIFYGSCSINPLLYTVRHRKVKETLNHFIITCRLIVF